MEKSMTGMRAWVWIALCALCVPGCILFEDTDNVTAVDVGQVTNRDTSGGDSSGDGVADIDPGCAAACGALGNVATGECNAANTECIRILSCNSGFQDCDGTAGNGCEVTESATRCGPTCADCTQASNSTGGECVNSVCRLVCTPGFLDCNLSPNDGCEASEAPTLCGRHPTDSNPNNPASMTGCVDCTGLSGVQSLGTTCEKTATPESNDPDQTQVGVCAPLCDFGFQDCNADVALDDPRQVDGCEQAYQDNQCGPQCDTNCQTLDGVEVGRCTGDRCAILRCRDGRADVDGDWVNGCEKRCALGECWDEAILPVNAATFMEGGQIGVAVGDDGLIYYTEDAGASWSRRASGVPNRLLTVAHNNENVFLALGSDNLLLHSLDRGLHWSPVLFVPPTGGSTPLGIEMDGDLALMFGDGLLLKSTDDGQSWEDISSQIGTLQVRAVGINGDEVFVGGGGGRYFLSRDRLATALAEIPQAFTTSTIRFFAFEETKVLAGGDGFVFGSTSVPVWNEETISTDGTNRNWQEGFVGATRTILRHSQGYAISEGGAWTVVDNVGAPDTLVGVTVDDSNNRGVIVGHSNNFGHVFRTTADPDTPYLPQPNPPAAPEARDNPVPNERRVVTTDEMTFPSYPVEWVAEDDQMLLMGGGTGFLMRSGDDAATWTRPFIDAVGFEQQQFRYAALDASGSEKRAVVAATSTTTIFTTDGGAEWTRGLGEAGLTYTATDLDGQNSMTTGAEGNIPAVFVSDGGGIGTRKHKCKLNPTGGCTLNDLTRDSTRTTVIDVLGDEGLVGTDAGEVLYTSDIGVNFESYFYLPDFESTIPRNQISGIAFAGATNAPSEHIVFYTSGSPSKIFHTTDKDSSDGILYPGLIKHPLDTTGEFLDGNTFRDPDADFGADGIVPSDLLVIESGPAAGIYSVAGNVQTDQFEVSPVFGGNTFPQTVPEGYTIRSLGAVFPGPAPEGETSRATRIRGWDWDGLNGVAVGAGGFVVLTKDGGNTWAEAFPESTETFTWVQIEGQAIVIASRNGTIVFSSDGGSTFSEVQVDTRGRTVTDMIVENGRAILVAQGGQLLYSYSGL